MSNSFPHLHIFIQLETTEIMNYYSNLDSKLQIFLQFGFLNFCHNHFHLRHTKTKQNCAAQMSWIENKSHQDRTAAHNGNGL